VISALREWMAELGKRAHVAVSYVGKFKTVLQLIALAMLIIYKPSQPFTHWIGLLGYIFIYLATILTLWSMIIYLKTAWPEFKNAN